MVIGTFIINCPMGVVAGISTSVRWDHNYLISYRIINYRTIVTVIQLDILCSKDAKYRIFQFGKSILRCPYFNSVFQRLCKSGQHLAFLINLDFAFYLIVWHCNSLIILFVLGAIEMAVLVFHFESIVISTAFIYIVSFRKQPFLQSVSTEFQVIWNGNFTVFITDKGIVFFSGVNVSCIWKKSSVVFRLDRVSQQVISHIADIELGAFQVYCLTGFRIGLDYFDYVFFLFITQIPVIAVVFFGIVWIISIAVFSDELVKGFQHK